MRSWHLWITLQTHINASELPNKPWLSLGACKKRKPKGIQPTGGDTPPQVGSSGQVAKRLEETSPPEVATVPGHSLSLSSKRPQLSLLSEPCDSLGRPLLGFHRAVWQSLSSQLFFTALENREVSYISQVLKSARTHTTNRSPFNSYQWPTSLEQ